MCYFLGSDRFEGVQSNKKDQKQKKECKIEHRNYHVTEKDTPIPGNDLKMKATGFCTSETGELYSGMQAHYHIHADPDLGVGKFAVQRIPCGWNTCLVKLRTKWVTVEETSPEKQPRFADNLECKYNNVYGIYDD